MLTKMHFRRQRVVALSWILSAAAAWAFMDAQPAGAMEDPVTGRWASRDPISHNSRLIRPGIPGRMPSRTAIKPRPAANMLIPPWLDQRNSFEFVRSNPLNDSDWSGLLAPGGGSCFSCGACSSAPSPPCTDCGATDITDQFPGTYCQNDWYSPCKVDTGLRESCRGLEVGRAAIAQARV